MMRFMTSPHLLVAGYDVGISLLFVNDWEMYALTQ